jgi:hypothetical protein
MPRAVSAPSNRFLTEGPWLASFARTGVLLVNPGASGRSWRVVIPPYCRQRVSILKYRLRKPAEPRT